MFEEGIKIIGCKCDEPECNDFGCPRWDRCKAMKEDLKYDTDFRKEYRENKKTKKFRALFDNTETKIRHEGQIQYFMEEGELDALSPLHGLYMMFKETSCGGEKCFNNNQTSAYYTMRCIPALCFARWLVLKGFAKFEYADLNASITGERKDGTQKGE